MNDQPWGQHAIFDAAGCDRAVVTDAGRLGGWVSDLVLTIGMHAYGFAQVIHFGEDALAGLTVIQLITTSNITAHFMDDSGDGYIDVFSCKPFDVLTVAAQIHRTLRPTSMRGLTLDRLAPRQDGPGPVYGWRCWCRADTDRRVARAMAQATDVALAMVQAAEEADRDGG